MITTGLLIAVIIIAAICLLIGYANGHRDGRVVGRNEKQKEIDGKTIFLGFTGRGSGIKHRTLCATEHRCLKTDRCVSVVVETEKEEKNGKA